jgi:amino-acid N-acetyltransferase
LFGKPLAGTTAGSETLLTAEAVPGLATVSSTDTNPLVEEILNPITRHTAVVKVQGPFTARQRHSIAEGLIYLQRLGLVSIIVVDDEAWANAGHIGSSAAQLRKEMVQMAEALAEEFESMGGRAIPLVKSLFRLKSQSSSAELQEEVSSAFGNPTTEVESLEQLKSAISRGEVPIIPPIAYDADLAAVAVHSNDAIQALVEALAMEGRKQQSGLCHGEKCSTVDHQLHDIDLTPLRMMVINREGGIPSPARGGNPHLSVNLESEFDYIHDTFIWQKTHPSSLSNLDLIRSCLKRLPRDSSAIIVSHRSPKALIANLITNKPAHSPSLHHSLLPAKQIQHTPTILRHGLPIRVIRKLEEVDKEKLTKLMEASFQKVLNADKYFARLEKDLDFVIVAGEGDRDYQAAAIVTLEKDEEREDSSPITYLDKFAVLPSLQGDGTVDFLWTALRDETFGLGLLDALNPNGGKEGVGLGTDLVWRSRADNPVNKWYFERSNGFVHIPEMGKGGVKGTLFWCDAEDRIRRQLEASPQEDHERKSLSMVMAEEEGRLARWARIIGSIKSCWL